MNATEKAKVLVEFGKLFVSTAPITSMMVMPKFLRGDMDDALVEILTERDDISETTVRTNLEVLKQEFRNEIQEALGTTATLHTQHEVSEHGTTAEIAEFLGVSKKQVRKMKKDGTLDAQINQHKDASNV